MALMKSAQMVRSGPDVLPAKRQALPPGPVQPHTSACWKGAKSAHSGGRGRRRDVRRNNSERHWERRRRPKIGRDRRSGSGRDTLNRSRNRGLKRLRPWGVPRRGAPDRVCRHHLGVLVAGARGPERRRLHDDHRGQVRPAAHPRGSRPLRLRPSRVRRVLPQPQRRRRPLPLGGQRDVARRDAGVRMVLGES